LEQPMSSVKCAVRLFFVPELPVGHCKIEEVHRGAADLTRPGLVENANRSLAFAGAIVRHAQETQGASPHGTWAALKGFLRNGHRRLGVAPLCVGAGGEMPDQGTASRE